MQGGTCADVQSHTLYLCMMTWPGLVTRNRPFLENWTKIFQKKWKTKVSGFRTSCIRRPKELGAIRRIEMREHLYWTIGGCNLGSSEVKYVCYLGVQHTHYLLAVACPPGIQSTDFFYDTYPIKRTKFFLEILYSGCTNEKQQTLESQGEMVQCYSCVIPGLVVSTFFQFHPTNLAR